MKRERERRGVQSGNWGSWKKGRGDNRYRGGTAVKVGGSLREGS